MFSFYLRIIILCLIIITLARPQKVNVQQEVLSKGIDIMLVLDTSRSMAAEDFKPDNRLAVAKRTIQEFIQMRTTDRIGLIVFGSESFTQCPLTTDYDILTNLFDDIELAMVGDGTAIGTALINGLNRLRYSESKSKIIILLTDGENNSGEIDPIRASELAKDLDIKVYTIGVGKEGGAPVPYNHPIYGKVYSNTVTYLDEDTLIKIARNTNGFYFRAKDAESLKNIYNKIDQLEKTELKTKKHVEYTDLFPPLIFIILFLLLAELFVFNMLLLVSP